MPKHTKHVDCAEVASLRSASCGISTTRPSACRIFDTHGFDILRVLGFLRFLSFLSALWTLLWTDTIGARSLPFAILHSNHLTNRSTTAHSASHRMPQHLEAFQCVTLSDTVAVSSVLPPQTRVGDFSPLPILLGLVILVPLAVPFPILSTGRRELHKWINLVNLSSEVNDISPAGSKHT